MKEQTNKTNATYPTHPAPLSISKLGAPWVPTTFLSRLTNLWANSAEDKLITFF